MYPYRPRPIRWDVRPHIFTLTHPATGEETTIYDAVQVSRDDGTYILPSELDRAGNRARRALRQQEATGYVARRDGRIVITPIYAESNDRSVAYVVAYRSRS